MAAIGLGGKEYRLQGDRYVAGDGSVLDQCIKTERMVLSSTEFFTDTANDPDTSSAA